MKRGQIYLVLLLMVLSTTLVVTPHTDAAVEEEFVMNATSEYIEHIVKIDIPAGTWTISRLDGKALEMIGGIHYEYTVPFDGNFMIGAECYTFKKKWTPDGDWSGDTGVYKTEGSKVTLSLFPNYSSTSESTDTKDGLTYEYTNYHYSAQQLEIRVIILPNEAIITPTADKEVTLLVNLNKDKLTTGEEIVVSGSVNHNGASIPSSTVQVELLQNGVGVVVAPNVPVNQDGTYTYQWKLESTATTPPTGPEVWTARVTSKTPLEYMDKSVDKNFHVLPFWVVIQDIRLAQSGESVFDGESQIAADVQAGIRVRVDWIGREKGFELPSIPVVFNYGSNPNSKPIKGYFKENNNQIYVDFFFTFSKGDYEGQIVLDSSNPLANIHHEDGTPWEYVIKIKAKKMKKITLNFVPVDLDMDLVEVKSEYMKFIVNQVKFIKEVYPVPENHIIPNIELTPREDRSNRYNYLTMINLLKNLAKNQIFSNSRAVGVLPDSSDWWPEDVSGMVQTFVATDKAVLVKKGVQGKVVAHEIGHTFGLRTLIEEYNLYETGKTTNMLILKKGELFDLSIPTPEGTLHTRSMSSLVDRERAFDISIRHIYCFMGDNSMTEWICDECYANLFRTLVDPVQPCLFVSGIVYENGTVKADPWYSIEAEPDVMSDGDCKIRCLDDSGKLLYNGSFRNTGNFTAFIYVIPNPVGTKTVELSLDNQVLYSATVSDNSPSISNPTIQHINEKKYKVSWTSSDQDGDIVSHLLYYSHDEGESWKLVSPEITETEYTIDLNGYPGGSSSMIRVLATDGMNAVSKETPIFSVSPNPPIAAIFTPLSNIAYPEGLHTLEGIVYDMEDGVLDTCIWTSDIDGILGTSSQVTTSLSLGDHIITLTGTDSNENTVETQTTVKIVTQVCTVTDHVLCTNVIDGSPVNVGNVFDPSSTVVSFLSLANATVGDRVNWVFTGFNGLVYEDSYNLEFEGDVYTYAPLNLTQFSPELSQGQWTVTVSINGIEGSTEYFTVEEILTGLVWWAPYVGALILVGIGAVVLGRLRKPKPVAVQVQGLCPTCSNQATWIPQYKRWYCYTCEKYLE